MSLPSSPRSLLPRRIVVGAGAHQELVKALRSAVPSVELRGNRHTDLTQADLAWGDTYVGFRRPPLATMGNIRWVHCTGAGVDSWLYPVELPRDILLTRTAESFGPMIAEWALARALAFTQRLFVLAEHQRRHEWAALDPVLIRGTRALVVGTGDVGSHVARVFGALGCSVEGVSRSARALDPNAFRRVHPIDRLARLVVDADWLIVALPLTNATRALISRDILARCRDTILINAGRGATVVESAIPEALEQGWLRGAALDVFEVEPLPRASALWDDPRVIISPHNSGPTTIDGAVEGFVECLRELESDRWPARTVDRAREY
jgi:phosphoglycerate dehydrogenase-like enzyme